VSREKPPTFRAPQPWHGGLADGPGCVPRHIRQSQMRLVLGGMILHSHREAGTTVPHGDHGQAIEANDASVLNQKGPPNSYSRFPVRGGPLDPLEQGLQVLRCLGDRAGVPKSVDEAFREPPVAGLGHQTAGGKSRKTPSGSGAGEKGRRKRGEEGGALAPRARGATRPPGLTSNWRVPGETQHHGFSQGECQRGDGKVLSSGDQQLPSFGSTLRDQDALKGLKPGQTKATPSGPPPTGLGALREGQIQDQPTVKFSKLIAIELRAGAQGALCPPGHQGGAQARAVARAGWPGPIGLGGSANVAASYHSLSAGRGPASASMQEPALPTAPPHRMRGALIGLISAQAQHGVSAGNQAASHHTRVHPLLPPSPCQLHATPQTRTHQRVRPRSVHQLPGKRNVRPA